MSETPEQEVYTVEEIAKRFKKHPESIRRLIKEGAIKGFKFGGEWRVYAGELHRYLKSIGGMAA